MPPGINASPEAPRFQADGSSDLEATEIHLWNYVGVVLQRLPVAVATFLGLVAVAAVYTWTRAPRYEATARILVERNQIDLTAMQGAYDPTLSSGSMREFLQTQVKLIASRPVLEEAIQEADLLADPAFAQAIDPAKELGKRLSIAPVRNAQLIDVSIQRRDPEQAARIINAIVDAFLADSLKRRMGVSEEGLNELRKKGESLRQKLDEASARLHGFMAENNMVSFEETQNIVVERLRFLNESLSTAEPKRMELQARVEAARAAIAEGKPIDTLPSVIASPVIRELKIDLSRQEQEYSQLLERLGENHAKLKAMLTQVEAAKTRLAMESAAIVASEETALQQAQEEERLLKEALADQERQVLRLNELALQYGLLKQARSAVEEAYNAIVKRIEEIDINRIGAQGNNIFVVSRAAVPTEKAWPNKKKNMAVALAIAFFVAVGMCFFLDYMDTTIKSEGDVRTYTASRVLAGIPDMREEAEDMDQPALLALSKPRSHFAEAFRGLRTALSFSVPGEPLKSIVVSSTFPEEGKSLVSINLAIARAQIDRRVLLVDADMRKPSLRNVFKAPRDKGLSNILAGTDKIKLDDFTVGTSIPGLFLLPSGPIPPNPAEILDSNRFREFLRQAESAFDFVVVDSPPGLNLVDSLVMGRVAGGLLLVIRSFVTSKHAVRQTAARLREADVRLLGVALNNLDLPRGGSYYGGYYGRYGAYYYAAQEERAEDNQPRRRLFSRGRSGSARRS